MLYEEILGEYKTDCFKNSYLEWESIQQQDVHVLFFLIPYSVVWNSNCDHRSCFLIEMRVKLKPLQHVLAFYKFACQLHDVACQVSERRCFSTHPSDEYNNDLTFTSRRLVAAGWYHCKVGTEHWSRFCAREQKPDVCPFFCRSWPLLIFLELFLTFCSFW